MKHLHGEALVIVLFTLTISGCYKPSSELIYNIDAEYPNDVVDLKLTDLANSFRLVPLETSEESLLDNQTKFYVNEKYIIAYSKDGVFKFSPSGKFVKKLIGPGRGPGEIVNFEGCIFVVDEYHDLLYISNRANNDTYLRYDLISEHFIEPVRRAIDATGYFDIVDDSLIIVSTLVSDSKYAIHFQNLKGEFVSGIINTKRIISEQKKELPQISLLLKDGTKHYCWFQSDDTLFQIKDTKLIPYLALNFKTRRSYPPEEKLKDGDRFIYFQSGTPSFLIIHVESVEDAESFYTIPISAGGKGIFLLFNSISGKALRINSYTDNFIGETKDGFKLSQVDILNPFFLELSNGKIITAYYPGQITKAIEKGLNNKDFPAELNAQLIKINGNLKEMDNPILLIGNIKEKL